MPDKMREKVLENTRKTHTQNYQKYPKIISHKLFVARDNPTNFNYFQTLPINNPQKEKKYRKQFMRESTWNKLKHSAVEPLKASSSASALPCPIHKTCRDRYHKNSKSLSKIHARVAE